MSENHRHSVEEAWKKAEEDERTVGLREAREHEKLEVRSNPPLLILGCSDTIPEGKPARET